MNGRGKQRGGFGWAVLLACGIAGCSTEHKPESGAAPEIVMKPRDAGLLAARPPPVVQPPPDWAHATCAEFNDGGACTPTEQLLMNRSPACYGCLANAGCLNSAKFGDSGHECQDVAGAASRGAKAGTKRSELCLSTLECLVSKSCSSEDVATCYCGSLGAGNGCTNATSGANGQCLQRELDGLEHTQGEPPKAVVPDFLNSLLGAGIANNIFVCANYNGCRPACAMAAR